MTYRGYTVELRNVPEWCREGTEVFEYYKNILSRLNDQVRGAIIDIYGSLVWQEELEDYKARCEQEGWD